MINNPYTERAMIADATMFFGREEELESIFSRLATLQSCSVVGQRRIGKSSLLYHLCRPEVFRSQMTNPTKCAFAYLDLQTLGQPTRERFFGTAFRRFADASKSRLCTDYTPDYDGFRTFIEDSHASGWRLVLCLDEFESITGRGEFDSDFFAFLRGLGSSFNLAYVIASRRVLHELCHVGKIDSSHLWNIFTTLYLGLLNEREAYDLVTMPFARSEIALSTEDVGLVLVLAGRHPFFLQIACCLLFEAKRRNTLDRADFEARFRQEATPYFAYIWADLDDEERIILQRLSDAKQDVDKLAGLERRGIVLKHGAAYHLFSKDFECFIAEQAGPERPEGAGDIHRFPGAVRGPSTTSTEESLEQMKQAQLRHKITAYFNESELRDLCADLNVDYENLPGEAKADKVRELVAYFARRGNVHQLAKVCCSLRPNRPW